MRLAYYALFSNLFSSFFHFFSRTFMSPTLVIYKHFYVFYKHIWKHSMFHISKNPKQISKKVTKYLAVVDRWIRLEKIRARFRIDRTVKRPNAGVSTQYHCRLVFSEPFEMHKISEIRRSPVITRLFSILSIGFLCTFL